MAEPNLVDSADGTKIAWYDFGGTGPNAVLGHATGFCAHVWKPVIDILSQHFHCFAYDLRGHGNSSSPGPERANWDWQRYADDLLAVIADIGISKPVSIGHSCGAASALLAEERQSGTFTQMIGFEPVMFQDNPPKGPDEDRDLAIKALKRQTTFSSRNAAYEKFSQKGPFTRLDPEALNAFIEHGFTGHADGTIELRCSPEDEAAIYVMASAHHGYVDLPNVEIPVTVVHGTESVAFDHLTMTSVAERIPRGRYVPMEGCGHFGALERPAAFVDIVLDACK